MVVLRKIHGDAIPEPTACKVTRWTKDPYARGSYSFVAVGASANSYELLGRPATRRVLFAGEHTSKVLFAKIWGGGGGLSKIKCVSFKLLHAFEQDSELEDCNLLLSKDPE